MFDTCASCGGPVPKAEPFTAEGVLSEWKMYRYTPSPEALESLLAWLRARGLMDDVEAAKVRAAFA